jgi:hypothetical protein
MFECSAINSAKKGGRMRDDATEKKGIMQFAKHVKQELVETSKKGSFREEFRDTKAREIGREKRPEYVLQ